MVKIGKYSVKEWWQRFRTWQRTPAKVPERNDSEQHVCLNCGESYEGAYCPRCGQTAKTKRLTLRNALSNMLDVWGLGSRSMPRALWHLLFRPGYMIADYLRGHRQPYFPPFKMLFILTATALILSHYLPNDEGNKEVPYENVSVTDTDADADTNITESPQQQLTNKEINKTHEVASVLFGTWDLLKEKIPSAPAVLLLGWQVLFTISTSIFFRRSPRMGRVTLTEQFYAQVLIAGQMQFLTILYMLSVFTGRELPNEIVAVFALIDYKQLYGYGWWGTLWRSALTYALTIALIFFLLVIVISIIYHNV